MRIQVVYLGLVLQTVEALLLGGLFHVLQRRAAERRYFRDWSLAWLVLSVALGALVLRYALASGQDELERDLRSPRVDVLYAVYQVGKLVYAGLLLRGAWRFARGDARHPPSTLVLALLLAYGVATALLIRPLDSILVAQAPLMAAACGGAGLVLCVLPRERRSFGSRFAATGLCAQGVLWVAYALAFASVVPSDLAWPAASLAGQLAAHNSFVDALLQMLVGYGMVVLLHEDVQRDAERARAAHEALERELRHEEKMRALGNLVSGIAHELNNPLAAILGFTEELLRRPLASADRAAVAIVEEQARRCRAVVRDLGVFTGRGQAQRQRIDPCEPIRRAVQGLAEEIRAQSASVELALADDCPAVVADPEGLERIMVNLVSNALHAGGRGVRVRVGARARGADLEVDVEDDGPGIPPAVAERIFEPFFTTKAPGFGAGLGLAIAHGIAESEGGSVRADPRASGGRGARFVLRLPGAAHAAEVAARGVPAAHVAPGAPGAPSSAGRALHVLVADDEPAVRAVLRVFCERHGWRSTEVESGAAALALLATLGAEAEPDVLLCDIKMADVSGIELYDALEHGWPALLSRTIFVTGDVAASECAAFIQRSRSPVVLKPFDFEVLAELVRRAADAPRGEHA